MSTASIARDVARINQALDRIEHRERRASPRPGPTAMSTRVRVRYQRAMNEAERIVRYAAKKGVSDPTEAVLAYEKAIKTGEQPGGLTVSRESGVKRHPARDRMASFRKWQDQISQWAAQKGLSADELAEKIGARDEQYRRSGSGKPRSQRKPKGPRRPKRPHGTRISGGRR